MYFSRCDDCCDVMEGISGGRVYNCSLEVQEKYSYWHLCTDCLEAHSNDGELFLYTEGIFQEVRIFKEG